MLLFSGWFLHQWWDVCQLCSLLPPRWTRGLQECSNSSCTLPLLWVSEEVRMIEIHNLYLTSGFVFKISKKTTADNGCFLINDVMWPWASYQIRKIAGAHAPAIPGTFSPPPRVCDPDMHHGTCVTHVPWCMPGSLTSGFLLSWRCWKCSRRMRNAQFYVSGKRPIGIWTFGVKSRYLGISNYAHIYCGMWLIMQGLDTKCKH